MLGKCGGGMQHLLRRWQGCGRKAFRKTQEWGAEGAPLRAWAVEKKTWQRKAWHEKGLARFGRI